MKNFFRILEPLKSHIRRMQKIGYSELMVRELNLCNCAAFDASLFELVNFIVCISGHCLHEIFVLREGMFKRIPDIVVWPGKL